MAHFVLQKLHKFPHELMALPRAERAFVYASTLLRVESEQKAIENMK